MSLGYLKFRCTQCGNCCKDPLLPLTDGDLRRISEHTGEHPSKLVRWVDKDGIDMDDDPEAFVMLRQGRRVMVLRHGRRGCRYLDEQNRCSIYRSRPLGCRIFPFDPTFKRDGELRRLKLIDATECLYELDGENDPDKLYRLHTRYEAANLGYYAKVAEWNGEQRRRRRAGRSCQTGGEFLEFLGFARGNIRGRAEAAAVENGSR